MAGEIDCEGTDEVVCPHCGHEHSDSSEFFGRHEDAEVECSECEKWFWVTRDVSVSYTSRKELRS